MDPITAKALVLMTLKALTDEQVKDVFAASSVGAQAFRASRHALAPNAPTALRLEIFKAFKTVL